MLYPKNKAPSLDPELFKNPSSEYRGTPFWAWNCELNKDELAFQIGILKEMGFGGFHMHSRTGMATDYLSEDFFDFVRFSVDEAKKKDMLAWLYDEDRWPSGSAGGLVTKNVKHRGKSLLFTKTLRTDAVDRCEGIEKGLPYLLAAYEVFLSEDGTLEKYNKIKKQFLTAIRPKTATNPARHNYTKVLIICHGIRYYIGQRHSFPDSRQRETILVAKITNISYI